MTALEDALTAAGHPLPRRDIPYDPTLRITYWNHHCGPDCLTWVPNHRRACARHTEESP